MYRHPDGCPDYNQEHEEEQDGKEKQERMQTQNIEFIDFMSIERTFSIL